VEEETDDDDNDDAPLYESHKPSNLDDVPEEEEETLKQNGSPRAQRDKSTNHGATLQQETALRELYLHEALSLLSCFALPMVSAYLLHYIRVQLSRPSEGLVSNFNLTIFLLISELRAFSHALKLVQSRTLHLQRVIHGNPFGSPNQTGVQIEEMTERLNRLEARSLADEFVREHGQGCDDTQAAERADMTRDVRNAIQPELDALNRAVRRYEKKATMLQHQTDTRFMLLDSRLDDAIALAAVAAKNSNSKNVLTRAIESIIAIVLFPFHTILRVLMLPLHSLLSLLNLTKKKAPVAAKHGRTPRTSKQSASRYDGDRVPPRVMKR
jgi:hypothetical protein